MRYLARIKATFYMRLFICLNSIFIFSSILSAQTFTKWADTGLSSQSGDWYSGIPVDFNNDYHLDIVFANNGNGDAIYIQEDSLDFFFSTSSNFVNQTNSARSCVWADIDNDCDLDVFWPKRSGSNNYLYENNGDGTFTRVVSTMLTNEILQAGGAAWGDFDNDGLLDLFIPRRNTNSSGLTNYIYKNNGGFNFVRIDTGGTASPQSPSTSGVWIDYDNDRDPDLYVCNRGPANNNLYINNGNGTFTLDTIVKIGKDSMQSNGSSWGDFNNDGHLDVFFTNVTNNSKNFLFQNNGNGTFTKITSGPIANDILNGHGAAWADLDNDGFLDLYTANNSNILPKNNIIYHNNGNGTFSKITSGPQYTETLETYATSIADINKDGYLDIINPNRFGGAPTIYINNGNSNHYINLKLLGSVSNRFALGSRVVIYSNLGMQTRYITQQTGWNSHDDFSVHFGLGNDTIIDSLIVYWPSGNDCILTNISVDQFYHLEEGLCQLDSFTDVNIQDSTFYSRAIFKANVSGASINRYFWDFGDGDTSNLANPNHIYLSPGKYEVSLIIHNNYCMHRVIRDSISICPDTSMLGFSTSSVGKSVSFIDTSKSNGYQFNWDFGDGQSGQGSAVNHLYANAGVYWVCLSIIDSCRTKQVCDSITVCNDTIVSNFSSSTSGLQVTFTDSSLNAQSLVWDFGDGDTSSSLNPMHTYSAPGYYLVCLTATGLCNSNIFCDTVEVCLDTSKANFNWKVNGNLVTFTDSSQHASNYYWDFGDGNFSTQVNPTHYYLSKGTYTVCLTISNDCYSDTICQIITLCDFNLDAAFTYNTLFSPVAIQFQDASTDAISWFWDFDDGSSSTNQNPVKVFSGGQTYIVCLTVTDSCNATDSTCTALDLTKFSLTAIASNFDVKLYPIPALNKVTIESTESPYEYEIFDLTGTLIMKGSSNKSKAEVSIEQLTSGLYLIRIQRDGKFAVMRLIVD